jgi:hypothetical protein
MRFPKCTVSLENFKQATVNSIAQDLQELKLRFEAHCQSESNPTSSLDELSKMCPGLVLYM